jgi:hypothetical protein
MIEELKKSLEANPDNPFLQGHVEALTAAEEKRNARRSAAACSPDDLRVGDADAVEIFVVDSDGERYATSSFANLKSALSWIALQPNRDSLRVAMTAVFILENAGG